MRWTDVPRDREPAGGRDSPVVRRGEWEDLRQRLERLPAGHPSSPDDEDRADEGPAGEDRPGEDRPGEDRADAGPADADRGRRRRAGGAGDQPARPGGQAGPDRQAGPPGGQDAGWARGPGRGEPYRPWFASGDSPEPWFSGDPGA